MRSVSRIYVNGGEQQQEARAGTPKLNSWKSNNSSPAPGSDNTDEL